MVPEVFGPRVEDVGHGVVDEGLDGGLGRRTEKGEGGLLLHTIYSLGPRVIIQPDFHGVLEDVPGAGGGDVVGDGGVVPHDEEAELLLVHPLILVVAVRRLLGLQMGMRF